MENDIKLKRFATHIGSLVFAQGAPLGSATYFEIRKACESVFEEADKGKDPDELHALAVEMRALQTEKDDLKDALTAVDARLDEIRLKLIPDVMADRDIRTVTFSGLGRVQLAIDVYATIKDKDAGYSWLTDNGFESLIQPYVQPGTFKATVKDALKKGQEFPEDIFAITPFTRASIVKVKV